MKVEFNFEFGIYNGSMSVAIKQGKHKLFESIGNVQKNLTAVIDLALPGELTIQLDGKNNNTDTSVDSQGNIVADKYVRLQFLRVGRVPVSHANLYNLCRYTTTAGTQINDTYWGWNGEVCINFDHVNPVLWHAYNNPKHVIG
jgi:hypothetical protein